MFCVTFEDDIDETFETQDFRSIAFSHQKPIKHTAYKKFNLLDVSRDFLALHFGKVFTDHGILRRNNFICMPRIEPYHPLKHIAHYCCNAEKRRTFDFGNNLESCSNRLNKLLYLFQKESGEENAREEAFIKALSIYFNALTFYNINETISFVLFVSAIESLTTHFLHEPKKEEAFEIGIVGDILTLVDKYIQNPNDKQTIENFIYKQYQSRQKFKQIILQYLDKDFYLDNETISNVWRNIEEEEMGLLLLNLYDLRSNYLHGGLDISFAVTYTSPIKYNKNHEKNVYGRPPAILIMECISRYVLNKALDELIETT